LANVSKKTVSRVINDSPFVKEETRLRVNAIIREVGFSPDTQARGLAFRRSFLIGMIYDNPTPQYIVNMQQGILDAMRGTSYGLLVHPCERTNPTYLADLRSFIERQKLFGVILTPSISEDERMVKMLREFECPYVRVASVMLDMGSTPYESLRALATKFVSALPQDHGASLLHLEVYADGEGGYLAGEVACRLGGGLIKDSIRHTYGVDLSRLGYLLATGIDNEAEPRERVSGQTGFLLWTATEPPPEADEKPAWCIKSFYCARTVDAVDSVDALGRFLVEGSCAEQIEARIRSLEGMGPTAGRQFS